MKTTRIALQRSPALLLMTALATTAGAQTTRYDTGSFEAPTFQQGELAGDTMFDGQDGWLITGDGGGGIDLALIQVQTHTVQSGSQAVEVDATGMQTDFAHLRRNTQFVVDASEPVVEIQLNLMIASSAQPTDAWGMQAQAGPTPATGIFQWNVFPDDHVYMHSPGIGFVDTGFVLTRDDWHWVQTAIDYQEKTVSLTIDGQFVGSVPGFGGIHSWFFAFSSVYLGLPGDDQFYFDDFAILTREQSGGDPITRYCTSTPNSTGAPALIDSSGSASVTANDLVLEADGLPDSQPGLFYYGQNQIQIPFGNGFRCVGGSLVRLPAINISGGSASHALDLMNLPGGNVIQVGDTVNFQLWYRDPAGGGANFNLSDGLSVVFQP